MKSAGKHSGREKGRKTGEITSRLETTHIELEPHEDRQKPVSFLVAPDLDGAGMEQKPGLFIMEINTHTRPGSQRS